MALQKNNQDKVNCMNFSNTEKKNKKQKQTIEFDQKTPDNICDFSYIRILLWLPSPRRGRDDLFIILSISNSINHSPIDFHFLF